MQHVVCLRFASVRVVVIHRVLLFCSVWFVSISLHVLSLPHWVDPLCRQGDRQEGRWRWQEVLRRSPQGWCFRRCPVNATLAMCWLPMRIEIPIRICQSPFSPIILSTFSLFSIPLCLLYSLHRYLFVFCWSLPIAMWSWCCPQLSLYLFSSFGINLSWVYNVTFCLHGESLPIQSLGIILKLWVSFYRVILYCMSAFKKGSMWRVGM